jgi:tight adherence protein B
MEFLALMFLFVLFMASAVLSDASARNQQRKREQIANRRLTPPTSLTTVVLPTPAPAAKAAYTNQPYVRRRLDRMIARAGLQLSPATLVGGMFALLVLGMGIAALWFELIISALCGFALATTPLFVLNLLYVRRLRTFRGQLPYVLDLLKSSLESGHSIIRALQMASQNMAEPTAGELVKVVEQVRVGMPLPLAIESMYRRVPVEELGFLAAATRVQAEIGSSLAEILDHVAQSIRTRQRLEAQIHTLTAQSRTSALIVALLPVVILAAFSLLKPDYARPLFVDPLGIRLLETAIILNVVAFAAMRRIARVDY